MKRQIIFLLLALSLSIPAVMQAQVITYPSGRSSDRQMRSTITRIQAKTGTFRTAVMQQANRSVLDQNREDRIDNLIDQFSAATNTLNSDLYSRRDINADVNDLLNRALLIDRFMTRNTLSYRAESEWTSLRSELDALARMNNVAWDWNAAGRNDNTYGRYPGNGGINYGRGGFDSRLTGTYRLNTTQSDNVADVLDRNLGGYSDTQRQTYRGNLERRLSSPDMLAIEKVNSHITMASSLAPQVSFDADGVAHSEVNPRGRTMTTTASADRSALTIRYQGERANDFTVTFSPLGNGQLRVVRTLYIENTGKTVSVASVYDKVDNVAQWSTVVPNNNTAGGGYNNGGYNNGGYDNAFLIPNGTRLVARLDNNLTTRASQPGDRFTMTVTSPYQYNGAVIEGHVSSAQPSGRLAGRANLSLDFDTIRMRDGRSYRFAGMVDSVRTINGDTVSVNNEGTVRDNNQTTKAVTRAGIGAVLGAIIGAVAGGGEGAAIGATVGAGAGAGSVLIQGRDNMELAQGSEFSITASAPAGVIR